MNHLTAVPSMTPTEARTRFTYEQFNHPGTGPLAKPAITPFEIILFENSDAFDFYKMMMRQGEDFWVPALLVGHCIHDGFITHLRTILKGFDLVFLCAESPEFVSTVTEAIAKTTECSVFSLDTYSDTTPEDNWLDQISDTKSRYELWDILDDCMDNALVTGARGYDGTAFMNQNVDFWQGVAAHKNAIAQQAALSAAKDAVHRQSPPLRSL